MRRISGWARDLKRDEERLSTTVDSLTFLGAGATFVAIRGPNGTMDLFLLLVGVGLGLAGLIMAQVMGVLSEAAPEAVTVYAAAVFAALLLSALDLQSRWQELLVAVGTVVMFVVTVKNLSHLARVLSAGHRGNSRRS